MESQSSDQIQIFIAYSRKDTDIHGGLVSHLSVLERNKIVNRIWYDGKIEAGKDSYTSRYEE